MKKFFFLYFLLFSAFCWSQQANDCIDAVIVCGNSEIASNASGFGTQELDNETNPCFFEEVNSLWFQLTIESAGTLAFDINPNDEDISVDYDFYIFGPNFSCNDFTDPIRCSTTNPIEAGLDYNSTGLRDSENEDSEGPGAEGNSYVSTLNVQAGETYYLLIDRPHGGGGFSLEWNGTASFLPAPEVQEVSDIVVCTSAFIITTIDLTAREAEITQSAPVQIDYFNSFANAFDFENVINVPESYGFRGDLENIYVRVANPDGCFEIIDFALIPLDVNETPDFEQVVCDTDRDGSGTYNLPSILMDIENTLQNPSEFQISLHPSVNDALFNTNGLTQQLYTTAENALYARVSSAEIIGCFTTFPIDLILEENPYPEILSVIQCDIDANDSFDGLTRINLKEAFFGVEEINVSFYETPEALDADSPITDPTNYSNQVPFDQILYYRVTTGTCISEGVLHLQIDPTLVSQNTTGPFLVCDDTDEDGILQGTFDLEEIRQNSYAGLDVAFYETLEDVTLEQNNVSGNYLSPSTTLYARLEAENQCEGVEQLELVVIPPPEINLDESYQLCDNAENVVIEAPEGFDSYTWYSVSDTALQEIGVLREVAVDTPGNFRLEFGTVFEQNGQQIRCINTFDFVVVSSSAATIVDIVIEEFSSANSAEIIVSGAGDYEYSLDGETYQDEPVFRDIAAGFYTIFVRDKEGCGISQEDISIIGYPKFFTPNADGQNDTWQLMGLNDTENIVTSVSIYDRYGKLIRVLRPDASWDGMYDGTPLPSSDYWFRISLEGRKEFKGHFSLKR